MKSPQLLNAITRALGVKKLDEQWDEDSDSSQPAHPIETIHLSEKTKDALLVPQELEWTRDLVLLKWHGTFEEPYDNGDDAGDDDDDDVERKDVRKC